MTGNIAVLYTMLQLMGGLIHTLTLLGNAPGKQGHLTQNRSSSSASFIKLLSLTACNLTVHRDI